MRLQALSLQFTVPSVPALSSLSTISTLPTVSAVSLHLRSALRRLPTADRIEQQRPLSLEQQLPAVPLQLQQRPRLVKQRLRQQLQQPCKLQFEFQLVLQFVPHQLQLQRSWKLELQQRQSEFKLQQLQFEPEQLQLQQQPAIELQCVALQQLQPQAGLKQRKLLIE
jgi:hypothetical protein